MLLLLYLVLARGASGETKLTTVVAAALNLAELQVTEAWGAIHVIVVVLVLRSPSPLNLVDTLGNSRVRGEDVNFNSSHNNRTVRADLSTGMERVLVDIGGSPLAVVISTGVISSKGLAPNTAGPIAALRPRGAANGIVGSHHVSFTELAVDNVCLVLCSQLNSSVLELLRVTLMVVVMVRGGR